MGDIRLLARTGRICQNGSVEPNPGTDGSAAPNGRWSFPAGVTVAAGVDLGADDPAAGGPRRRCVAVTRAGKRCPTAPRTGEVLCAAHAGHLDASAGGRARAQHLALVREEAQNREINARLGARAVIAARAIERASDLRQAFDVVLDDTIARERGAARNLLGMLALAFPEMARRAEEQTPGSDELTTLSTDQLRALAFQEARPGAK